MNIENLVETLIYTLFQIIDTLSVITLVSIRMTIEMLSKINH